MEGEKQKKQRIKNKNYRRFLDEGIISTIGEDDMEKVLHNVSGKNRLEGRSLIILMYYTGCRPVEALRMAAKDIYKEGVYLAIKVPASKRGLPRTVYLPYSKKMVKELWDFVAGVFPERILFYNYIGRYVRKYINKRGECKERVEVTDKLRWRFMRWFSVLDMGTVPPYYLRHNRFSKLAEQGATMDEMRVWKGAKTYNSIFPYMHMSSEKAKKLGSKID